MFTGARGVIPLTIRNPNRKTIFETLLGKPVRVELEKAIGRGDDICRYVVQT